MLVGGGLVEPPAAGQVVAVVAPAGENAAGDIAAQTTVTVDIYRLARRELSQTVPKGV